MYRKTIEATEMSVQNLFGRRHEQFYIPIYQRRYLWGKDQWQDLWNDITSLESEDDHFLGSIVVITPQHTVELNQFEIVDGQQRLITLSLALAALRDSLNERGNLDELGIADNINNEFLQCSTMMSKGFLKLLPGKLDKADFSGIILQTGISEKDSNINNAYYYFINQFSKETDILALSRKIIYSLKVVLIQVISHKDAFRLFETLNDRGLSLSATDLIKNYLLSRSSKESEQEFDQIIEIWDEVIELVRENDSLRFFRQFLLAKFEGVVSFNKLYDRFKKYIDNNESILELVEEIRDYALYYSQVCNAATSSEELNSGILNIHAIGAATSYTLLMKMLKIDVPIKEILKVVNYIKIFALRRAICNWSTANLDRIYNTLAVSLPETDQAKYVVDYFIQHNLIPSDVEFKESFTHKQFRQDDQCKYILERFEDYYTHFSKEKSIGNRKNVHIEHIMPKVITTKKSKKEHGDWESYLGQDSSRHNEYVNRIGNLTLLGSKLNIQASNNPFEEKKKNYEQSTIVSNKKTRGNKEVDHH